MPRYLFGSQESNRPGRVLVSSGLKRAIMAFRATELYPDTYSTAPIFEPDEVVQTEDRHHNVARASEPGALIRVWGENHDRDKRDPETGRYPEAWVLQGTIPITDPRTESLTRQTIPLLLSNGQEEAHGAAPEDTGTALVLPAAVGDYSGQPRSELATLHTSIERKKAELERVKEALNIQIRALKAEMHMRLEQVWWIELFLGSEEEVKVLRRGEPASEEESITVHQRVYCMDEEILVHYLVTKTPVYEVFDYRDVGKFDEWLVQEPGALDSILPEAKGMAILRPRRRARERVTVGNPLADIQAAEADEHAYVLVRNGENLYRLWIDAHIMRVFPRLDEYDVKDDRFSMLREAEFERTAKSFLPGMLVLYGLLQRSDLFQPLPPVQGGLNPFNPRHVHRYFTMVRDDEPAGLALVDTQSLAGRLTMHAYLKWLRSQITVGTRIIWAGTQGTGENDLYHRTWIKRLNSWPDTEWTDGYAATYTIDEVLEKKSWMGHQFRFLYMPEEWWRDQPRTRRVGFYTYADELFPVDLASRRVIEVLLRDRAEREHYMDWFTPLRRWYRYLEREEARERPFVDLVLAQAGLDPTDADRARVERLTRWWKLKVKEARTLTDDEPKALRMILSAFKRGDDHDDDPEKALLASGVVMGPGET